jgi:hypothetical protein
MAKPALPWLRRLCALYEKHDKSVYSCIASPHVSGVLVSIELDRGMVYLLAQRKHSSTAYGETASMSVSMHRPEHSAPAPGDGEWVTRQFLNVLTRADKGDIRFTSDCLADAPPDAVVHRAAEPSIAETKAAINAKLNWAAFLATKVHANGQGALSDLEPPHAYLVDHFESGFLCSDFQSSFGLPPYKAAPEGFDTLVSLGVVSLLDDAVSTHIDSQADALIYRTFLFSPSWVKAATTAWATEYQPSVDYAANLTELLKP